MKTLFLLNDAPYGNERCYNALRLAGALFKREGQELKVFLIGDAISCANKGQKVPQGYEREFFLIAQASVSCNCPNHLHLLGRYTHTLRVGGR
ncbi:MAG: hypothetical protein CO021_05235 [Deltaproteobacteria bacterium CG_4_9_14_0_2_um_filter_42_21]|nr:MAG: hypothetical protein CO021_05235 [Deltaproteobacteria bacterium CG_4_9_14_0_2_um_filter_42_21]